MAINFPTSLDVFTDPTASDQLNLPSHSGQHTDLNNAVEALEAKVGIDGSAVTSSLDYKIAQRKILQVVQTVKVASFTTTSATLVDITGLSVSITPSSATSKVLVQVSAALFRTDGNFSRFSVYRGDAATGTDLGPFGLFHSDTSPYGWVSVNYLDSPATTSATTYQAALGAVIGGGTAALQGEKATITVWEVAA